MSTATCPKCRARFQSTVMGCDEGEMCQRCWDDAKASAECNEDGEGCTAGPEGTRCGDCDAEIARAQSCWAAQWRKASQAERDPVRYRADMIDAGRGHLLGDDK